ncbi:MAG: hypothetical protein LBU65_05040, partial [Planctomycetaceae bacterium]|nr:hypothetical protein [Planctomycetaceae bacterium]
LFVEDGKHKDTQVFTARNRSFDKLLDNILNQKTINLEHYPIYLRHVRKGNGYKTGLFATTSRLRTNFKRVRFFVVSLVTDFVL